MKKLILLAGASCVGKSTLVRYLEHYSSIYRELDSVTTRELRVDDPPSTKRLTQAGFDDRVNKGLLINPISLFGNSYAYLKEHSLQEDMIGVALVRYNGEFGMSQFYRICKDIERVYLHATEEELEKRAHSRNKKGDCRALDRANTNILLDLHDRAGFSVIDTTAKAVPQVVNLFLKVSG